MISLEFVIAEQARFHVSKTFSRALFVAFHNFEHASHVCMSVAKLMSRIGAPDQEFMNGNERHDHTYGITFDPLTQFACVFAALIHDADHSGVPNSQLVKEKTELAHAYKNKSVAEQNSVNLAWNLLMDSKYKNLRDTIWDNQQDMLRFRQLVVNAVMATDIMDNDLKKLRESRWERAFSNSLHCEQDGRDSINRKATIVIEHLIQASDVAHTMQHWHIYRKWNEKLFVEMSRAFEQGRAENDPSESWYKGELLFFDCYVIPLARKLSDCGVFGVASGEYLNYAVMNRNEWEDKGKDVVRSLIEKLKLP
jgi:3'5'-cyclic nucleotide phosphodiesterase